MVGKHWDKINVSLFIWGSIRDQILFWRTISQNINILLCADSKYVLEVDLNHLLTHVGLLIGLRNELWETLLYQDEGEQ